LLQPYIQYVVFHSGKTTKKEKIITAFANTNICFGIVRGKELVKTTDGFDFINNSAAITSYVSGLYLNPFKLRTSDKYDEICVDFTPLGFYKFFKTPVRTFIFGEDLLPENFGKGAISYFEEIFESADFEEKGRKIENFFIKRLLKFEDNFLEELFSRFHLERGKTHIGRLARKLKCSERKIHRRFTSAFDVSPKEYNRIIRFRHVLWETQRKDCLSLAELAYEYGFTDQSHFIKEIKFFTEKSPLELLKTTCVLSDTVILEIN
jgi:AraC-like DNA-binding protein